MGSWQHNRNLARTIRNKYFEHQVKELEDRDLAERELKTWVKALRLLAESQ